MTEQEQQVALGERIRAAIDYFRKEYDMSFGSVVGVLEVVKLEIVIDAKMAQNRDE